jgi:hypothetical protein
MPFSSPTGTANGTRSSREKAGSTRSKLRSGFSVPSRGLPPSPGLILGLSPQKLCGMGILQERNRCWFGLGELKAATSGSASGHTWLRRGGVTGLNRAYKCCQISNDDEDFYEFNSGRLSFTGANDQEYVWTLDTPLTVRIMIQYRSSPSLTMFLY